MRHQCSVREWRFLLPVNFKDHAFRSYSYMVAFALNVAKHFEGTLLSDVKEIFDHHGLGCALLEGVIWTLDGGESTRRSCDLDI